MFFYEKRCVNKEFLEKVSHLFNFLKKYIKYLYTESSMTY